MGEKNAGKKSPFGDVKTDWQAAISALIIAVFAHALVLFFAPRSFSLAAQDFGAEDELKIDFLPPETQSLTTPQFIEANPAANDDIPENPTPFESYKNQSAAQEADAAPENSNLPQNEDGMDASHKIVSGNLQQEVLMQGAESVFETLERPLENPSQPNQPQPAQAQTPPAQSDPAPDSSFIKDASESGDEEIKTSENFAPQTSAGDAAEEMPPAQTEAAEAAPQEPLPAPKPRPHLSLQTAAGPLAQSSARANKIGLTAVDSRFSEFGAYEQRMVEAIARQWYLLAAMHSLSNEAGTQVVIEFFLNTKGEITSIKTIFNSSTLTGKSLCEQAILSTAPYGAWTPEMLAAFGSQDQSVRFTFLYR